MKINKIHIDEVSSTNSFMKDISKEKEISEGVVVWADFQTNGRGQVGTAWESESAKNLLFSIVLYPDFIEIKEQFIISQIASLAIKELLEKYVDDISIKWPNDVYWKDRKICGMLVENDLLNDKIYRSVIGIGININQDQFRSDAPNPVSLKQITHIEYNREKILDDIQKRLLSFYELSKTDKEFVSSKYKQSLYRRSGYHSFCDKNHQFKACIKDITTDGFLILSTLDGEEKRYAFKEVRFN